MYSLVAVVLILLGVYLVTRVLLCPLRERLPPTDKIKEPTLKDAQGNLLYDKEEIERIATMIADQGKAMDLWGTWRTNESDTRSPVTLTKDILAGWVARFYKDVYSRSQGPITRAQTKEYSTRYLEQPRRAEHSDSVDSLLQAYFIDQPVPAPAPAPVSVPTPAPAAAAVSVPTPAPAPAPVSVPTPAQPAPAPVTGSDPSRSTPAPIDVAGPATITINIK
jgi:hypothetical protein